MKSDRTITDMIKNTASVCHRLCLYLALCCCGILFWRSLVLLRNVTTGQQTRLVRICGALMVPGAVCVLAAVLLAVYYSSAHWPTGRRTAVCLMAVLVLAQVCFLVFVSRPAYTTDTLRVHQEAIAMLNSRNGWIDEGSTYFQRYTNNHFIVVFFYYYYRLLSLAGVTDFWLAAVVLNTVCIDLGVALTYLSVRKLRGERLADLFLVLSIFCPTNYVWLTFAYTNTVSIPFVAGILYLFLIFKEQRSDIRQIVLCILYGLCIVIGYQIRPTTVLPLIAIILYGLYKSVKPAAAADSEAGRGKTDGHGGDPGNEKDGEPETKGSGGRFPTAVLCGIIALSCLVTFTSVKAVLKMHVPAGYEEEEFPLTHWVMMGLNDESDGGIYSPDVEFTRSFPTKAEKTEQNIMEIRRRLKELGPSGYARLVIRKLDRVWADGSDTSFEKASYGAGFGAAYEAVMGRGNLVFRLYCQALRAATFLFAGISILYQISGGRPGKRSGVWRRRGDDMFVCSLTLLGCVAFFVLWEANPKYNICFMNLCTMLMADGVRAAAKGIEFFLRSDTVRTGIPETQNHGVDGAPLEQECVGQKSLEQECVEQKSFTWKLFKCGRERLSGKVPVVAVAAGILCLGAVAVTVTGLHYSAVDGNNIRYVYRAEMQDKGFIGKQYLKKAVCIRQTIQNGEDREKKRWNTLELVFAIRENSRARDSYHVTLRSMPGGNVLYEADISREDLGGRGRYQISGDMRLASGDTYYELELRHRGRAYSMYPRLQRSDCLDMYPYGELSIDGTAREFDLCMEIYDDRLADENRE